VSQLAHAILEESLRRELTYTRDDGRTEPIPLYATPAVLLPSEIRYVHRLCLALVSAFQRVAAARAGSQEIRALLPLSRAEEDWLSLAPPGTSPMVARWDMNIDPTRGGARAATLFEMNGCAVGGLHYAATSSEIVRSFTSRRLALPAGMGALWYAMLGRHTRTRRPRFVWLEDRSWTVGITEGPSLCTQHGPPAHVADPRDLSFSRTGALRSRNQPIDVVYRSIELADLIAIERATRRPLSALRRAFRERLVISPVEADLDHKSLLEILGSPRFAGLFPAATRKLLARHVPWTRLLTARRTESPDGASIDLPAYARRHRARLAIKPNRSCGGEGILLGPETSAAAWDRAIARALSGAEPAVVQSLVDSASFSYEKKTRLFTTYGFFATPDGLGVLGRAAPFRVVNVARGGGLLGVLVGRR
jgi:hypothetical protein